MALLAEICCEMSVSTAHSVFQAKSGLDISRANQTWQHIVKALNQFSIFNSIRETFDIHYSIFGSCSIMIDSLFSHPLVCLRGEMESVFVYRYSNEMWSECNASKQKKNEKISWAYSIQCWHSPHVLAYLSITLLSGKLLRVCTQHITSNTQQFDRSISVC